MIRCFSVAALLLSALPCIHAQTLQTEPAAKVIADAAARGTFSGVVVIAQHGKVLLARAVGQADRAAGKPMRVDTTFRLASLTKQVTALLVMQQVVAGKLRLEEPAGEVLPSLAPTVGRVTVQQLLQHISGLPNPSEGSDGVIPAFYKVPSVPADYQLATATGFCGGKPTRDPDTKFEYNNCDYLVLGAMLQKLTGMTYAQLVTARIVQPLHLASWGVFTGAGSAPATTRAYSEAGLTDEPQNPATYGAAGALYGNALDVATWDAALLNNTLLPAGETAIMFHGERNLGGEALGSWSYDLPGTAPAVHLVERQGDIGATRLLNLLLPDLDGCIVILANTERADLFNTYSRQGLGYDLVKAAINR